LDEPNRQAIADSKEPLDTAYLLNEIKKAELSPDNRKLALKHEDHDGLAYALERLRVANLNTENNFRLILNEAKPAGIGAAIEWLRISRCELQE